mgnify:CR=1 FL=1
MFLWYLINICCCSIITSINWHNMTVNFPLLDERYYEACFWRQIKAWSFFFIMEIISAFAIINDEHTVGPFGLLIAGIIGYVPLLYYMRKLFEYYDEEQYQYMRYFVIWVAISWLIRWLWLFFIILYKFN